MTPDEACAEFSRLVGSRIFGATFRRADGCMRVGTFRIGVRRPRKGNGLGYDPGVKGNVIVYDMRKREYRTIKLNRLVSIRICGVNINLEEN
jgi:hypothetical protein